MPRTLWCLFEETSPQIWIHLIEWINVNSIWFAFPYILVIFINIFPPQPTGDWSCLWHRKVPIFIFSRPQKSKEIIENDSDSEEDGKKLVNQIDGLLGNLGVADPLNDGQSRRGSRRNSWRAAGTYVALKAKACFPGWLMDGFLNRGYQGFCQFFSICLVWFGCVDAFQRKESGCP